MWWILFSNTATSKTVLLTQTCQTEPQLENAVLSNELFHIVDLHYFKDLHSLLIVYEMTTFENLTEPIKLST